MNEYYPYEPQPLPYDYNALEPHIDERTLHFHHDKHYVTYVNNLNQALKDYPQFHKTPLTELLAKPEQLPAAIQTAVINNGGGVYNHELYFAGMTPKSTENTMMNNMITEQFGSMDNWKAQMKQAGTTQFGSGWAVFATDANGTLYITKVANQDTTLPEGLFPLLMMDVWEHAYYLQYQNRRPDYIDEWFPLVNWEFAMERYNKAVKR